MKYVEHNKKAWNNEVKIKNQWTMIINKEYIEESKKNNPKILLTPNKYVPLNWVEPLKNKKVLGLASGGGQQGPILSSYGCDITIFDNSEKQLEQEKIANKKYNLNTKTILGDMRDLSRFEDESFDCVINPISNVFINEIELMQKEVYRVLKKGGYFLSGNMNPVLYIFDEKAEKRNKLKIKYTLPYSDIKSLSKKQLQKRIDTFNTIEFSHTLDSLIGNLCNIGFSIIGFYSDSCNYQIIDDYIYDSCFALRCIK